MPTGEAFWKDDRVIIPHQRETVTMDLDADVVDWFRRKRGFQARINAILRANMKAQNRDGR
jgi:uncharacterized protein (DUF4415 family)